MTRDGMTRIGFAYNQKPDPIAAPAAELARADEEPPSSGGATATLWEKVGDNWVEYDKIDGSASYEFQVSQQYRGNGYNLGNWYSVYDWNADDGFTNLADWVK